MNTLARRYFLKAIGAAFGGIAAGIPVTLLAGGEYGGSRIPFGLQLYSVRKECAKDLDATVAAVAKMGYKAVEFAGYHGRDAKSLRKLLDDCGVKCCGTHIALDTMQGDKLAATIEFNQTLGNKFLIVPNLPRKYTQTHEGWIDAAGIFNEIAEKVRSHGLRVGYHNHNVEFKPLDGEVGWDTFFNRTNPEVAIQFDTGNGVAEGGDPMIYLPKKPGRVASVHVKPYSKSKPRVLIGDDELPWKEIFKVCETSAGVEWYIIEYESDLYPPLEAVQKSLEVMRRWGKC
jgi:sugar phosphate isomerase/epimerase